MSDEIVIQRLRESRKQMGPISLALLLEREIGQTLSDAALISYFKRAFPDIPLATLYEASSWHRVGKGSLDDAKFERLLKKWLPGTDFDDAAPHSDDP